MPTEKPVPPQSIHERLAEMEKDLSRIEDLVLELVRVQKAMARLLGLSN